MSTIYDYVIVGAGPAGCVLANRLTADSKIRVALLEAGPTDRNPFIHIPKGSLKVMQDPAHVWIYPTTPENATANKSETWVRGRVLGGSSAVNGMMYVRGQPADYDALAELTSDDWSWEHIGKAYSELENHELGKAETRGDAGPLRISLPTYRSPLTEAMIKAGAALGWPIKKDVNEPDNGEAIGYAPRTTYKGKRQSAAVAFLRPIMGRSNLTVMTETLVDKVVFEGKRSAGVSIVSGDDRTTVRGREVVLCGGAMATPGLLERSGIGDPKRLADLGIDLVHANPAVGENLIEHRSLVMQWRLSKRYSQNLEYQGWRLFRSMANYYVTGDGPMSGAAFEIGAWFKSRPGQNRPDAQLLIAPFSFDRTSSTHALEKEQGMCGVTYVLRPSSLGNVHINSTDPAAIPVLQPNFRDTEEDRAIMVASVRLLRRYADQEPLRGFVRTETVPGPQAQTDAEILAAYDQYGTCGYHAVGSCRMGKDSASVVDPLLRVREIEGLRIIDTSVMPTIPSGNTNGPTMAMAWRGADIILREDSKSRALEPANSGI